MYEVVLPDHIDSEECEESKYDTHSKSYKHFFTKKFFSETIRNRSLESIVRHDGNEDGRSRDKERELPIASSLRHRQIDSIDISESRYKTEKVARDIEWDLLLIDKSET